jgi:hypothetical protein
VTPVHHDHVIDTLATDRADDALGVRVLERRLVRGNDLLETDASHLVLEGLAFRAISSARGVAIPVGASRRRSMVER